MIPAVPRRSRLTPALLATGLCLSGLPSGCSGIEDLFGGDDGGSGSFSLKAAKQSSPQSTVLKVRGRWVVYLASEATTGKTGKDFNKDGDQQDLIAAVIDLKGGMNVLDVSAEDMEIVGDEIFVVTDEKKDSTDWDGDGTADELVLLHWSTKDKDLNFLATLDTTNNVQLMPVGEDRLYFLQPPDPGFTAPQTTLHYVTADAPLSPVQVFNADFANSLRVRILGADEGLLFLSANELVEARDLNGDGDQIDQFVIGLVDGTSPTSLYRNTGLASTSSTVPRRALPRGPGDWLVAFLVNENRQGQTNFNHPALFPAAWQPPQCAGTTDTDFQDDVLFYIEFAAWSQNPFVSPPVNTGLVGVGRVLCVEGSGNSPGFVATVSLESNHGGCSLNGDGDSSDLVFRWTEAQTPILPFTLVDDLVALDVTQPGDTLGASDLDNRFLVVVDEAEDSRNHDGKGANNELLAWLDPRDGPLAFWTYDHSSGSGAFIGPSWVRERAERDVLLVASRETVLGLPLNSADSDTSDSVPTYASFLPPAVKQLQFPGPSIALDADDAGIVIADDVVLYRVDEQSDNRDWDEDGDVFDIVLLRSKLDNPQKGIFMATLRRFNSAAAKNNGTGPGDDPVVVTDGLVGAAFLAQEAVEQDDLNGDGDTSDFVIRHFRF